MRKIYCFYLFSLILFSGVFAGNKTKGHLLIIGGGEKPRDAIEAFAKFSSAGNILVITSASSVPEESGPDVVGQIVRAGGNSVDWLHIDGLDMANADSTVAKIEAASAVFFTGGDQERLMGRIRGSRSEQAIKNLYHRGGIIGGTSAGAAVMSEVMITGNELINKDTTNIFLTVQARNVETKKGLGFLDKVIIDQHFAKRKRHNRLISLVLEHPELQGIGIDEDTAILVEPDLRFRVYGAGPVIVYDARKAKSIHQNENGLLGGRHLRVHVLLAGDTYQID